MKSFLLAISFLFATATHAADLKVGDSAPTFSAKNQAGETFDLQSRKGQWTVLFFFPIAGSPGCTKQVCAFRDSINRIKNTGAEVYGMSADTVEEQKKFHDEHSLKFDLLADPDDKVIELYGTKFPIVSISKRWTFIIDPELKIASIDKDVDPAADAQRVADKIKELKKEGASKTGVGETATAAPVGSETPMHQ